MALNLAHRTTSQLDLDEDAQESKVMEFWESSVLEEVR